MSIRIIAGLRRGAVLQTPEGFDTRPLRDRIRESLFNILRPNLRGGRVLDAFAGSGAVGLEAVSRGATWCGFVEAAPAAQETIRRNIAKLRFEQETQLVAGKSPAAFAKMRVPGEAKISHVFLMPSYHSGLCWTCLESTELATLVADDAMAICELHREEEVREVPGWEIADDRLYGITRLMFLKRVSG